MMSKGGSEIENAVIGLLAAMSADNYDPKIVSLLQEYTKRYTLELLKDAQDYAYHAGRKRISVSDTKLAVQLKQMNGSYTLPDQQVMVDVAADVNSKPLPPIPEVYGVRLPGEGALLTPNFQVAPAPAAAPPPPTAPVAAPGGVRRPGGKDLNVLKKGSIKSEDSDSQGRTDHPSSNGVGSSLAKKIKFTIGSAPGSDKIKVKTEEDLAPRHADEDEAALAFKVKRESGTGGTKRKVEGMSEEDT
mmetsp:Transcript_26914/g.48888  ORF Transcript_26914/g.48888 Transcript_26914/m.48888 type:complete len:245 (+) Transcript_26914:120-854(+)